MCINPYCVCVHLYTCDLHLLLFCSYTVVYTLSGKVPCLRCTVLWVLLFFDLLHVCGLVRKYTFPAIILYAYYLRAYTMCYTHTPFPQYVLQEVTNETKQKIKSYRIYITRNNSILYKLCYCY